MSLLIYAGDDALVAALQEQRQDALREIANCCHQIADLEQQIEHLMEVVHHAEQRLAQIKGQSVG